MKNIIKNALGEIHISKEVIAIIAGNAAMDCYGLVGMASRKMSDGITELLGRENLGKGVEVKISEDVLTVDLYIVVQYGTKIHEVAHNVIEKVDFVLKNTLGFSPDKINVIVHGVRTK
ncbi:MAG TPA: Asp23/Gls24 family envelope stress response protein [Thermoanaerobacterales bacterium]|uniref:Asp23/Gls24 family envelope stress response protein n=1 Tax=Tepidanaerobacter sp. GT38 TaxID=2722793 RepID=UPI00180ED513|nr:Asp23/Gls24 family envelope stress response protein [Tepidanaerobacter sp. GT38]MCG1012112.1 Asp23/Gls24 family envelope stress response protein [Tepidanaerobacter sp. GT38]HHY43045.1 Asp23/Gls24 family envelope stress response protein [Thermoanaerobacterales bacterium]